MKVLLGLIIHMLRLLTSSLVEIYHAQGRVSEAEPLIAQISSAIHEQALGSEHPYIAYSLSNQS